MASCSICRNSRLVDTGRPTAVCTQVKMAKFGKKKIPFIAVVPHKSEVHEYSVCCRIVLIPISNGKGIPS